MILDARAAAMVAFDRRDVGVGVVGEDRLEAMPVVVGERQLRARVRALATDEYAPPLFGP